MNKNKKTIKPFFATLFVALFIFLISGIKSDASALSNPETVDALKQQITTIQLQIAQKQIIFLKQQIAGIQVQIIALLQQRIANVQTQIAAKQKQIASVTPSTPAQKIDILEQQIADIQTQIAAKQKQIASLTPSTPAAVSPSSSSTSLSSSPSASALAPSTPEGPVGSESIVENPTQGVSTKNAPASITSFFSTNNFSQLFFFIAIVIIALAAITLFRSKNKQKNWIPYLVILIVPFIYRLFYSKNWLTLLALSILLLIGDWMLQGRKEKQVQMEI